ncbi:hypothetical protein [Micromonospora sp. NPDC001898]
MQISLSGPIRPQKTGSTWFQASARDSDAALAASSGRGIVSPSA